jgi:hypothetical protein
VDAQLAEATPGRRTGSRCPDHQRFPPRYRPGRVAGSCEPSRLHRGFPGLRGEELVAVAERVSFLHGHGPTRDPVIRVGRAIAGWRHAFPELRVVTIHARQGRWHLPLIERPKETVHAILAG